MLNRFAPRHRCLGVVLLVLVGCAAPTANKRDLAHMLCVDADGEPAAVEVRDGERPWPNTHDANARHIARAYYMWRAQDPDEHRRIMFVFHGGLVSMEDAVADAEKLLQAMRAQTATETYACRTRDGGATELETEPFFPILVNWETGIFKSYYDHLLFIRAGAARPIIAPLTSPFILLADFGRAVMRLPMTYSLQFGNAWGYYFYEDTVDPPAGWGETAWIDRRGAASTAGGTIGDLALGLVPGVFRALTTPILDGAGLPAFGNMRRRARLLFVSDADFERDTPDRTGGLSKLMEQLGRFDLRQRQLKRIRGALQRRTDPAAKPLLANIKKMQQQHDKEAGPQVTIIAHSMGTIVANELIRSYGSRRTSSDKKLFDFRDIVYMGAACTIKEFANTALVYVRQNPQTRFYNLCLHPKAEEDDRYAYGALPHGSLLEWIDSFITEQESEMDRVLGKWNNIMRALPIVDFLRTGVRDRIVIRAFPRSGSGPTDHGHFNDVGQEFWKPPFWDFRIDQDCATRWIAEQRMRGASRSK